MDKAPERIWLQWELNQLRKRIAKLEGINKANEEYLGTIVKQNIALRSLIECHECSAPYDDKPGWMPGLCPGCQAEQIADLNPDKS